MQRVFRPLAVFSIATGACLALGLQLLVDGARGSEGATPAAHFFSGYDLGEVELVGQTLYHIDESYVDPARIDWEAMYVAALDAVERRVPTVLLSREPDGQVVAVEIGDFRTVLDVATVRSRPELKQALGVVAALLQEHLRPEDIPGTDAEESPYAQVEYAAINGILGTLDPHSVLLPPEDAREMDAENQGEFGGLGIEIDLDEADGRLRIVKPKPGTPAARQGLRKNDHILRIDGESTVNLDLQEAVKRLRGPVGASIELEIERAGAPEPFTVKLVRELISYHPVTGRLLPGGIACIRIEGFHGRVDADLHRWLGELTHEAGGRLSGLVLDMRGNPGGFLNQAVKVADTFLESGEIVSTVDREGRQADREEAKRPAEPLYPIVVLVDADSASASEIVAGALRYNERAVILGERTFGKGSVQNLHEFEDGSKLKLTISKYLTAGDRSLQAVGIPADIELEGAFFPKEGEDGRVYLFAGQSVRREADLDRPLDRVTLDIDPPAYRVRYLEGGREVELDDEAWKLEDAAAVWIARDLLDAANGWRRSDVLSAAGPVVARHQKIGGDALTAALAARSIDWRTGPALEAGASLPLELSVEVSDDGDLDAGLTESVAVTVRNVGARPLYRVAAIADDEALLGRREFLFGALAPGEKRTYVQSVEVPQGWPSEQVDVTFALRDAGTRPIGSVPVTISYVARPRPAFAWQWAVSDQPRGDGDGVADPNEKLTIAFTVTNVGEGSATDAFARLRNHAGTRVDLVNGTLLPGTTAQSTPASPCGAGGDPCQRILAPGASWSGAFEVDLQTAGAEPIALEVSVGDGLAYDQAALWHPANLDTHAQREPITVTVGGPLPSAAPRRGPTISLTRAPALRESAARVAISGAVEDDQGLAHVLVFVGDDKVRLESVRPQARVRSLPFTADAELEPGPNVITVLATDDQGFRTSQSLVVWGDGQVVAQADRSAEGPAPAAPRNQ